jgi:hypothetical protein
MRRFFISQHPTFGSFANPVSSLVEKSPYYFWWLALTLNEDYVELCNNSNSKRFKTNFKLQQIFKDFGDVRYEGSKHQAFCDWWNKEFNNTETKGQYLFAEPLTVNTVMVVEDKETAINAVEDASSLLIRIPTNLKRNYIDSGIERIFAKQMTFERGRQTRNPSRSNARYYLSAPIMVKTYKIAFGIYENMLLAESNNEKLTNFKLAEMLDVKPVFKSKEAEYLADKKIVISTKISRKKKEAKDAISNVVLGIFP